MVLLDTGTPGISRETYSKLNKMFSHKFTPIFLTAVRILIFMDFFQQNFSVLDRNRYRVNLDFFSNRAKEPASP